MNLVLEVQEREYIIVGRTASQLEAAMALLGPTRGGRVFPAYTDWSVDWSYRAASHRSGFAVDAATVRVDATVTLPRWRSSDRCSLTLRERWAAYRARLQRHEQLHVRTAEDLGQAMLEALRALSPRPTRSALRSDVEELARHLLRGAQHADRRHDVVTMGGL